ncbi:uncharacterized protein LOC130051521 [Ostrea edulis]|uniref:uncharacterized protein LOC130051521 n=1 Tax=Ostrea edulis TaxID=37623 RepID=UPI0024AE9C00|nr:uncharacterized protein LOC130051521 [Ostrea edulis]
MINNTDIPSKECRNLLSAISNPHIVDDLLNKEVEKGFLQGPFDTPPFTKYRVSPIGVSFKKYSNKGRLIMDLSAPHSEASDPSINSLIDKEKCSLSYVTTDDAIKIIQKLGFGTTMCKTDISDAFKLIPISPSQWHLFLLKWKGLYYFYTKLAFGCRSSPRIFDCLAEAICWIATHNYGIKHILHLLDDFITFEEPEKCGERNMALLMLIFKRLNIPIAKHKTEGPDTTITFLGITLDSVKMEARLPPEKISRIISFLDEFLQKKSCTKRELLQILGHLSFASRVIVPGRSFVSQLITLSTSVKQLHFHVTLNKGSREDMNMWLIFLKQWNGISMFYNQIEVSSDALQLYTDASGTLGYGGFFQGRWFSESWPLPLQRTCKDSDELSIAFRELYPIVVAALLWGHSWRKQRIVFSCDNQGTVAIINKGRSKCPKIMALVRRLTLCAANNNFVFKSKYFEGHKNVIADCLSRLQIPKFRQLVPAANKKSCTVPGYKEVLKDLTVL